MGSKHQRARLGGETYGAAIIWDGCPEKLTGTPPHRKV
jgi:hypothetical protein